MKKNNIRIKKVVTDWGSRVYVVYKNGRPTEFRKTRKEALRFAKGFI